MVEQTDDISGEHRIAREESDIGVEPRGPHVIVAGSDVCVTAQAGSLFPHDERDFRVGLQIDLTNGHVRAGALELGGPMQVPLLVEPRLQLDDARHLLARFRRPDERPDEWCVVADAVHGHLDGDGVRILGTAADEPLDALVEAVYG